jgi:hypothetical protein
MSQFISSNIDISRSQSGTYPVVVVVVNKGSDEVVVVVVLISSGSTSPNHPSRYGVSSPISDLSGVYTRIVKVVFTNVEIR